MLKGRYEGLLSVKNLGAVLEDDFTFDREELGCVPLIEGSTELTVVDNALALPRFEDSVVSVKGMQDYVVHVLSNTVRHGRVYKEYVKETEIQSSTLTVGDDNEVNVNELQQDNTGDKLDAIEIAGAKKELAYCLYRLSLLSRQCGVNMLSVIMAYLVANPTQAQVFIGPSKLLNAKPVYFADIEGNCASVIRDPANRKLVAAYGLINKADDGKYKDFRSDIKKTFRCLRTLRINPRADDPTLYTSNFCKRIAHDIMIDNWSYVARKYGGYSRDVLSRLKGMSLDMVVNQQVETIIDPEEEILELLCTTLSVPESIKRAFSTRYSGWFINHEQNALLNQIHDSDLVTELTGSYYMLATDDAGFRLSEGGIYTIDITKVMRKYKQYTTMQAYVHGSGWVVCLPTGPALVMARLDNFVANFETLDYGEIEWYLFEP